MDLQRSNQQSLESALKHMTKRSPQEDSRKVLAEVLAPLNRQIMEVKAYYEETKSTASHIATMTGINIAAETGGYDAEKAAAMVDRIHDTLTEIFTNADELGVGTEQAAERFADERIAAAAAKGAPT